jgi:hypothetical protein
MGLAGKCIGDSGSFKREAPSQPTTDITRLDEGWQAHIFQILMITQLPIIAAFVAELAFVEAKPADTRSAGFAVARRCARSAPCDFSLSRAVRRLWATCITEASFGY